MKQQSEFVEMDWRQAGYIAYPQSSTRPPAGTYAERLWCMGWNQAQTERQSFTDPMGYAQQNYLDERDFYY